MDTRKKQTFLDQYKNFVSQKNKSQKKIELQLIPEMAEALWHRKIKGRQF